MRISAIMPCFNCARFLREAIESARGQTRKPDEIVCVDDGSADETWAAIQAEVATSNGWIRAFRLPANRGAAAARNAAIAQAIGGWLAFLEADDLWAPGRLEKQSALIESSPATDLVHSDAYIEAVPGGTGGASRPEPRRRAHAIREIPADDPLPSLFVRNFVVCPTVMARRETVARVGGFDERVRGTEDYDLWLRLAAAGARFGYVGAPLATYRLHGANVSANRALILENEAMMFERMLGAGGALRTPIERRRARARMLSIYFALATEQIAANRLDLARESLDAAFGWAGKRIWRLALQTKIAAVGLDSPASRRAIKRLEKRFRLESRHGVY